MLGSHIFSYLRISLKEVVPFFFFFNVSVFCTGYTAYLQCNYTCNFVDLSTLFKYQTCEYPEYNAYMQRHYTGNLSLGTFKVSQQSSRTELKLGVFRYLQNSHDHNYLTWSPTFMHYTVQYTDRFPLFLCQENTVCIM